MATIKFNYNYSYRQYPNAPFATALDKKMQQRGFVCWLISALLGAIIIAVCMGILAVLTANFGVTIVNKILGVVLIFGVVFFFLGFLITPWLFRKLGIIDAIAKLEQKKNRKA